MAKNDISINALKRLSKVGDRRYHERYGEYLIEGIRLVEEAFLAEAEIREIAVEKGSETRGRTRGIIESAEKRGIQIWMADSRDMRRICRTENNQGMAAGVALSSKVPGDIYGELLQIAEGLVVYLDGVQDPGNVGTIIRICEAFAASGIVLGPGSAGLYNPKTIRATMGAIFRVPTAEMHLKKGMEIISNFKENGFAVYTANDSEGSVRVDEITIPNKLLLIIGREGSGVSMDLIRESNKSVHIYTPGPTESLNAAVASGILMYALISGKKKTGDK